MTALPPLRLLQHNTRPSRSVAEINNDRFGCRAAALVPLLRAMYRLFHLRVSLHESLVTAVTFSTYVYCSTTKPLPLLHIVRPQLQKKTIRTSSKHVDVQTMHADSINLKPFQGGAFFNNACNCVCLPTGPALLLLRLLFVF